MTRKRRVISGLSELAKSIVAVIIGVFVAVVIIAVVSRAPGHEEIFDQQARIESQLTYLSCLLLIAPEDRLPEAVAACQVPPSGESGG